MFSKLVDYIFDIREKYEKKRIQLHLKKVEEDLREKENGNLKVLDQLKNYRHNGEFPSNPDFRKREPYFVGSKGIPCAVGYLMLKDGEKDLVNRIREEKNNLYLEDTDDDKILNWIDESPLSREEAERIQPAYPSSKEAILATNCGPVSCGLALATVSLLSSGAFFYLELGSYRHLEKIYPEKPLKRTGAFTTVSVLNGVMAVTVALIVYALLP